MQIGRLGFFCDKELAREAICALLQAPFINWESSVELRGSRSKTLQSLHFAHRLIFELPPTLATLAQTMVLWVSYIPQWLGTPAAWNSSGRIEQWISLGAAVGMTLLS